MNSEKKNLLPNFIAEELFMKEKMIELHNEAIVCAEKAKYFFIKASNHKAKAASYLQVIPENEPYRSILYLSAAAYAAQRRGIERKKSYALQA